MGVRSTFGSRLHLLRAPAASKLGPSVFDQAKGADAPYSEARRKAERLWPPRARREVAAMNTTNLFVELIVIGVGALAWLTLLVLALFGWEWVPTTQVFSTVGLVPILSLIYVLGVVSDRIADLLFDRLWERDLRKTRFLEVADYHAARRQILTRSERLSEVLEYMRSRLRICRGWALNSVLIAVALNLFIRLRLSQYPSALLLSLFGTAAILLFAAASWYTWRSLTVTEYRKVKELAAFLLTAQGEGQLPNAAPNDSMSHA